MTCPKCGAEMYVTNRGEADSYYHTILYSCAVSGCSGMILVDDKTNKVIVTNIRSV